MDQPLHGKTIILGITGSIAAYKAADLTSQLRKKGADVFPVLTAGAQKFITSLTLQTLARHPVAADLWTEGWWIWRRLATRPCRTCRQSRPAPRCACHGSDVLAQFAHGLAPDFLSSLYLVCRAPVLLAPAMNGKMWAHPATLANVATLKARGHEFIGPEEGMLACGYEGLGRLWLVEGIVARAEEMLKPKKRK